MTIPTDDVVRFVLRGISGRMRSQKELSEVLLSGLRKNDASYVITGERARRIALQTPGIKAMIHTKRGPVPNKCPACGGKLRKSCTKNLRGRKVLFGLSCTRCPYSGKNKKWIPSRYEFAL